MLEEFLGIMTSKPPYLQVPEREDVSWTSSHTGWRQNENENAGLLIPGIVLVQFHCLNTQVCILKHSGLTQEPTSGFKRKKFILAHSHHAYQTNI